MVSDLNLAPGVLEKAVLRVADDAEQMFQPVNWTAMEEAELWHELVSCLVSSGVQFELAAAALANLDAHGLLNWVGMEAAAPAFEQRISDVLSKPIDFQRGCKVRSTQRYRFPRSRANYIRRTAEQVYRSGSIKEILATSIDSLETRRQLINICVGIGPKQSSLFLRNVGLGHDLAIIDVHVARYLRLVGLMPVCGPGFGNLTTYEKVETVVQNYSIGLGLSMQALDIAIWIVMRVAWKDFRL